MEFIDPKKKKIASLIKIEGTTASDIYALLAVPQDSALGDYALPCFRFAKEMRMPPAAIATKITEDILSRPHPFAAVEAVGGYVNFRFDALETAAAILDEIITKKSEYGTSLIGAGKTVCIDYSSINIAKPFHIGHLSTTVIGGALYRIYKKLGYNAVGINHLGDWGTQFGKLIVAYKRWGNKADIIKRGVSALNEIYVKFHKEAENNAALEDEARYYFKKIEDGDKEAMELFSLFKDITLKEVDEIYKRLDIQFDSYNGEAFYNDKMQPVLDELESLNLVSVSQGAKIVDLEPYGMPPCLLVKADGATLYATRDLAAAFYRKATYCFYKCLYVVAYQQNLHFQQVFKVVELMGKEWAKDLVHIPFGMVSLEDGTMSTRKGKVVLLKDVFDRAVQKSLEIISEKSPALKNKEVAAEKIGVGAVVFSALSNNRIKDIVFSYDKVLNFDGETAPYIQYTNARARSVLRNLGANLEEYFAAALTKDELSGIANKEGEAVISLLERFPAVLFDAVERYEPSFLTRYIIDLSKAFNKFYLEHRILNAPDSEKRSRAALVYAVHTVIEEGLHLLGIAAPEEM
ncbi:MAG: arginine--tRNA ligase [Clostridia bacterium]